MTHAHTLSMPTRPQPTASANLGLTLLGPSPAMSQLWSQLRRLAPYVRNVLLTGEQDCGQEAVARLLLDLSPQNRRTFVQITAAEAETRLVRSTNFTTLPSDLFLYLPEIDQFSLEAQDGLLRLMRTRRSRPFTLVASTSEDLRGLAGVGRFSTELADALSCVRLAIPCLKDRPEDIPMLVSQMLSAQTENSRKPVPQVTDDFLRAAMEHTWPGNLRELARTLTTLSPTSGELRAADLHRVLVTQRPHRAAESTPVRMVTLDSVVQEHISGVLRACRGNKLRAAEVLGISRSTLYRMLDGPAATEPAALAVAS